MDRSRKRSATRRDFQAEAAAVTVFGDIQALAVFAAASAVLILMPGDNLFLMAQSMLHGRSRGLALAFGLALGNTAHTTAAVLGAAVIFQTSAAAFTVFKVLGVGYLLFLAWRTVREFGGAGGGNGDPVGESDSGGGADGGGRSAHAAGRRSLFFRGLLMNVLNPKVSLFFLAFLPQFVPKGAEVPGLYMASLGGVFVLLTALIFSAIVLLSARIGALLRRNPAVKRCLAWLTASVFVALGLRLAAAER